MATAMIVRQCPHYGVNNTEVIVQANCGQVGTDAHAWNLCQCRHCQKTHLVVTRKNDILETYPFRRHALPTGPTYPAFAEDEFWEAGVDLEAGCYLSSMTMSRRGLQRCLKQQGFDQRQLIDQIDAAKSDGTIAKRYHTLADEIREYGNIGAHPDDDKRELATRENAQQLLRFVELLVEDFYVLPAQAVALTKNRKKTT